MITQADMARLKHELISSFPRNGMSETFYEAELNARLQRRVNELIIERVPSEAHMTFEDVCSALHPDYIGELSEECGFNASPQYAIAMYYIDNHGDKSDASQLHLFCHDAMKAEDAGD